MSNAQYLASLVNSSGNIVIPVANAGIVFNNTNTTASPTSTTQNDYETGTWTPTLSSGSGSYSSVTYTRQYGKYTKIGNLVYASIDLNTSSQTVGTASSDLLIAGLPFTIASASYTDSFTGYIAYQGGLVSNPLGLLQNSASGTKMYIGLLAGSTLQVSSQGTTGFGIRGTFIYPATF